MNVNSVATLEKTLHYHGISIEKFKQTSYQRIDTVGVYASETLRKYLFKGNVSPDEEGLILWLFFEPRTDLNNFDDNESFYYLIGQPGLDENTAKAFLRNINNNMNLTRE